MSSSVSATLGLELHARRWQTALALAAVCACALVPWCLRDLPGWEQLIGSLLGVVVGAAALARAGWLPLGPAIVRLQHIPTDDWHLEDRTGRAVTTRLRPQTRFFRHFVWLQFESRHSLLLGPGDLTADQFRRLQVLLRQNPHSIARVRVA